jgi:predicted DNA binding CopG/RHH family protein
MRLPEGDMKLARAIAAKRGLRYQTYLKTVIHSALQNEARKILNGTK